MSRPKCPVCEVELEAMPDLFGERRYKHPDGSCHASHVKRDASGLTIVRQCIECGASFRTPGNRSRTRKICSDECLYTWRIKAGRHATAARMAIRGGRKPQRKKSDYWRRYWQTKVHRFDERVA